MENIAHTLCGFQLANLGFRDDLKRAAPWVAVISANLPDLDSVALLFGRETYLLHHRGFTHSFFGWPFLALLGAFLSHKISRASSYSRHLQLWVLGLFSHALLDWLTTWGTLLLWPIPTRFSLEAVFIVDPMFWLLLGLLPVLLRRRGFSERAKGATSLLVFAGYLLLGGVLKEQAGSQAPQKVRLYPAPFAPLFWTGVHEENGQLTRYWLTPWSSELAGTFTAPTPAQEESLRKNGLADAIFLMANELAIEAKREEQEGTWVTIFDLSFTSWLSPSRAVLTEEFLIPNPSSVP